MKNNNKHSIHQFNIQHDLYAIHTAGLTNNDKKYTSNLSKAFNYIRLRIQSQIHNSSDLIPTEITSNTIYLKFSRRYRQVYLSTAHKVCIKYEITIV